MPTWTIAKKADQKITHNDNRPGPGRNYGETTVFTFGRRVFFVQKSVFPKKHPKFAKRLIFILEKGTFFFEQLFPVVARTWLELKSECLFLGPKFQFLVQKSDFCHMTPILVDDPFLALGMTVNFPPWKPFFDFPFRSYSCFRKKI